MVMPVTNQRGRLDSNLCLPYILEALTQSLTIYKVFPQTFSYLSLTTLRDKRFLIPNLINIQFKTNVLFFLWKREVLKAASGY